MSILSQLWHNIKGGRTDVQTVFGLFVGGLSVKQRAQLCKDLSAVSQAIEIASLVEPNSTQVKQAQIWIEGAFEVLQ